MGLWSNQAYKIKNAIVLSQHEIHDHKDEKLSAKDE